MPAISLAQWHAEGERVQLSIDDRDVSVFRRCGGESGGWWTMLHGWPTSSWDWAQVAPAIEAEHRTLSFDFPGLGASGKGDAVRYDIDALTETVCALWAREGITSTRLVAHDVGTIVAQELLARELDGTLDVDIESVTWLNGSIYPELLQPLEIQVALRDPDVGPELQKSIGEELYTAGLAQVHHEDHQPDASTLHQHWVAFKYMDGPLQTHRFLQYMFERIARADRLVEATETSSVPFRFVWGLADPVSGARQVDRLRERFGAEADIVAFADCAHYPHLERPDDVVAELLRPWRGR